MYQAHHLVTDLRGGRIVRISPDKVETTRQLRITEQNGQIVVTEDNRCLGDNNLVPDIPTSRKRLSKCPQDLQSFSFMAGQGQHIPLARSGDGSSRGMWSAQRCKPRPRSHQMTTAFQIPELGPPLFMWAVDASHHRSVS